MMQMQKDGRALFFRASFELCRTSDYVYFAAFPCSYPGCGNVFISMSSLRRHERTHNASNGYQSGADGQESVTSWPTMCVCELCHEQFDSSTGLEVLYPYTTQSNCHSDLLYVDA